MKKITHYIKSFLVVVPALFLAGSLNAQISEGGKPTTFLAKDLALQALPLTEIAAPDAMLLNNMDRADEKNGVLRKIGRSIPVSLTPQNSGTWDVLPDGGKIWRLKLHVPTAKAIGVYYDQFYLPAGSKLFLYNETKSQVLGVFTSSNNPASGVFSNELVEGQTVTLEYYQPAGLTLDPTIRINELAYIYRDYEQRFDRLDTRDFGDADATCEVNVNCAPEGTAWQNQKRSVVRILVKEGSSYGWCSGSLLNNTAQNCSPYILTADHCSGNGVSSTADLNQWIFYFNYEGPSCANPASEGTLASKTVTGCALKARAGGSGTIGSTSDFYLVLMNSSVPTAWNPFYAGWSRVNTASPSGVSIHHPAGDIKKISTYTAALIADRWTGGTIAGTHWRVTWAATTNGHGVTEGGSSGSPIFDNNGRIIGQLSGGGSYCTALTSPDLYGAFWYDWDQNTLPTTNNKLKPWLDPGSTGVTTLNGTNAPCGPSAPVADFAANNVTPCIGSTVIFTDASTGTPTSWAWTFAPTTVTYVGGTSATSQNPQVQFNAAGPYTVTLTATNSLGSDGETKTSYITPTTAGALPFLENFEAATFPPTGWSVVNADAPSIAWATAGAKGLVRRPAAGNTGSTAGSAAIECFNYNTDTTQLDAIISKPISLVGSATPRMTFKRAYKWYGTAPYLDELRVFVSSDCGATYGTAVYYKKGAQLASNGLLTTTFTPAVVADWDIDTVNLTPYAGQNITVKFEVISKYGNNLYLDDINITNAAAVASVAITSNDADNTICAGTSVTFTAAPTNGGSAPTYQWKVNGTNVGTGATYTTSTLTTGQVVTCVMTSNLAGVTASPATSNSITMTVNAIPSAPTAATSSPDCVGQTISLNTPAVTGATYAWTGPSSFTSAVQNPTRPTATAAMAGTYSVTVTVNGCTSAAGTSAVVINPIPATPTAGSNTPVCAGSTLNLTSNTVSGATYAWTGPSAYTAAVEDPTRPTATAAMAGTYSLTVTVSGCTSVAATTTVAVNALPSTPAPTSNSPVCAGSAITFTTPAVTGATYAWTGPSAYTSATQNPSRTGATAAMAGTYSLTVTVGGCTSLVGTTTVTVNALPATPAATSNSPVCSGSAINLTAPTVSGATYAWSGPSAYTSATQNPSRTGATAAMAGTYSLTVTVGGCTSLVGTTAVVIANGASAQATSTTTSSCTSSTGTISLGATTGGTSPYTFSVNGSGFTTSTSYTSLAPGTYPVIVQDANGCQFTTSATVTSASGPTALASTTVNSTCGNANGTINVGATTGGTGPFIYSIDGSAFTTTTAYTGLTAGAHNVTVKDANGCTFVSSVTVVNSAAPTAVATTTTGSNCGASDGTLSIGTVTGGTGPFTYSVNSGASTTATSYTGLAAGTYSIDVTDANGCTFATTATITNTGSIPSTPTISEAGFVLTSSSATDNQWYQDGLLIPGATGQTYTATANGTYTVVVTTGGCASATSAPVVIASVGIEETSNPHLLSVYPNPNDGNFTVSFFSVDKESYTIELTNALGQIVYKEQMKDFTGKYTKQLSVESYGKGIYMINLTNTNHETVKKIVVY